MEVYDGLNDIIDLINSRNETRYKNNCYYLGGFRIKAKRSYYKLKDELEHIKLDDSTLGKTFTLDKDESHRMLSIVSLPTVVASIPVLVGGAGVVLSLIPLFLGIGQEMTPEVQAVNDAILKFLEGSGTLAIGGGSIALKTLPLPLVAGIITLIKTELEKKKVEKREDINRDMRELSEMIEFITDLKMDKTDISLNFIKEFLSNVDITRNSHEYNLDLLYYLLDYRKAVVSEKGKEVRRKSNEKLVEFVEFLADSTTKDGADSSFVHNLYVNNLVECYAPREDKTNSSLRSK